MNCSTARKPEAEFASALGRLIAAGLLFRQGVPPHATYLFKHALVQDAAYGTLLREPRRALHARIAETIESQLADTAENRPELLARHCAEAGQTERAAALWGKAGQRSLERSALVERTDGIPLFVEEMTKAVLEAEGEGAAERTVAAVPSPALAVPASLHSSLMARLDRLGHAKEVAQIGAAIGREFSHALLAAVVRLDDVSLLNTMRRMHIPGLLRRVCT
jgi:predicted ATPase